MNKSFDSGARGRARRFAWTSALCALCVSAGALFFSSPAEGARPFVVGGRALVLDRPFRPGPASDVVSAPLYESYPVVQRVEPAKTQSVIRSVSPPRVVPHFLPEEGDYTPHTYKGVTVVAIPPQSAYVPDPMTGELRGSGLGYSTSLPATIPGPRQVTPSGLRPGTDPFRPSPFDPDVTRRQGFRRF